MRTVYSKKIDAYYISNPYSEAVTKDQWPVLVIDNKVCALKAINGIRPKYFYKKQFVVKFNDEEGIHTVKGIIKLHKKIVKNGDGDFFPEILAYDTNKGFIVQQYVPLTLKGITKIHRKLVDLLTEKYELEDICTSGKSIWNWGLNARTKNIVIYDFVA